VIRVGLLIERFAGRDATWAEMIALAVAAVIVGAFAWFVGLMVFDSWRYNEYAQGVIAIPIWIPQFGMAFGIVVMFVAVLDELVRVARGAKPSYEKPEPTTPDEIIERAAQSGV
jgi:TRAP-type C4-dicarboxylate transport system permease small subunit